MATMKVDSTRWELVKDAKEYNAFVWTGLTLGKLYALRSALTAQAAYRGQTGNRIVGPISQDCLIILTRTIESAEAAEGHKPMFAPS